MIIKFLSILLISLSLYANQSFLTPEEKAWIADHPVIQVGVEKDWAPYDYVDKHGKYVGMAREYLNIISEKTGIKFEYEAGKSWSQLLDSMKEKKIDMLPALYFSPERSEYMEYTNPYMNTVNYLYIRESDTSFTSLKDINNKKIVLLKDNLVIKDLKKLYPNIEIIEVDSVSAALEALLTQKADGYIDLNYVIQYYIQKNFLSGFKAIGAIDIESTQLHMAIQPDLNPLVKIINKVLNSIDEKQRLSIYKQWSFNSQTQQEDTLNLTPEEKEWIKNNTVKVGVENWAPIVYYNTTDNNIDGMAGDYLKEIVKKTGLKVEFINDKWNTVLNAFKDKKLDLLTSVYYTDERATHGTYSNDYFKTFDYIYVKQNNTDIKSMKDLKGKKLVVVKGYGLIPRIESPILITSAIL